MTSHKSTMGNHSINHGWDFRRVYQNNAAKNSVYFTALKKDAIGFAKAHGWLVKDVKKGYNRFNIFYFVGQMLDPDTFNVLKFDGTTEQIKIDRSIKQMEV